MLYFLFSTLSQHFEDIKRLTEKVLLMRKPARWYIKTLSSIKVRGSYSACCNFVCNFKYSFRKQDVKRIYLISNRLFFTGDNFIYQSNNRILIQLNQCTLLMHFLILCINTVKKEMFWYIFLKKKNLSNKDNYWD